MKKEIFYQENTILDLTYTSLFKEDILNNALFPYIKSKYPDFLEINRDYINDRTKIDLVLKQMNLGWFIVLDRIDTLWNNEKYIFELQQKSDSEKDIWLTNDRSLLWLWGYKLSAWDELLFNSLRQGTKKSAILKITDWVFTSYLDEWVWHCPIEYYLKWKVELLWIEKGKEYNWFKKLNWPYDWFNNFIKNNTKINWSLKLLNMKSIYLSNKEKFARWVYEWLFFVDLEWKYIKAMEYDNEETKDTYDNLLKTIYTLFDDYMEEYIIVCPFANIEDIWEVKKRIRKKLYH